VVTIPCAIVPASRNRSDVSLDRERDSLLGIFRWMRLAESLSINVYTIHRRRRPCFGSPRDVR